MKKLKKLFAAMVAMVMAFSNLYAAYSEPAAPFVIVMSAA